MRLLTGVVTFIILGGSGFVVFTVEAERSQFEKNKKIINLEAKKIKQSTILVAAFTRSKNTELMAQTLVKIFDADYLQIKAKDYKIGYKGFYNSFLDAQKTTAEIKPISVDLSAYKLVILGSPIWWYSPAPPVWQFIKNHDLAGKKIILFNTFNSRFKGSYILQFKKLVENQGGEFLKHVSIKRNRIVNQIDHQDLIEEAKKIANEIKNEGFIE